MRGKKFYILVVLCLFLIPLSQASPNLEVSKEEVRETVIPELGKPAVYELTIKNNGQTDKFEIYSLVGVDIKPDKTYEIENGEEKTVRIELQPNQAVLNDEGNFNFIYKIKGEETGIFEDSLIIKIRPLSKVLDINSYPIGLEAKQARVYIKNLGDYEFENVKANFDSAFFHFSKEFSLDKYEKKEFTVQLDEEKVEKMTAGSYQLTSKIETEGVKETITNKFKFKEEPNVDTSETEEGLFINTHKIVKNNNGNLPIVVQARMEKNILSRLFTYFNQEPASTQRQGLTITYTFKQEVRPGEEYVVKATTNWIYPLLLLIAIGIIIWLVSLYTRQDLTLRKRTTYAKTKSGKFALKVSLIVRAKKYVENIKVIDKVPSLVKVHKRFGANEPDKIDEKNRRLEWNLNSLQEGEERIFSYIIYSDVAPVGKFELPTATAIYEKEGEIGESESNRVFFVTEKKKKAKKEGQESEE